MVTMKMLRLVILIGKKGFISFFFRNLNSRPSDIHQREREMMRWSELSELLMNTTIVVKRQKKSESIKVRVRVSTFLHLFLFNSLFLCDNVILESFWDLKNFKWLKTSMKTIQMFLKFYKCLVRTLQKSWTLYGFQKEFMRFWNILATFEWF